MFRPQDGSPSGRIQRFQLIRLKPKHHRLDVFNYSCYMCLCDAELKNYSFTYLPGDETSWAN